MSKYVNVLLTEDSAGVVKIVQVPTEACIREGDMVLIGSNLYTVVLTNWMDPESNAYRILSAVTPIYTDKKILRVKWEPEEANQAESE